MSKINNTKLGFDAAERAAQAAAGSASNGSNQAQEAPKTAHTSTSEAGSVASLALKANTAANTLKKVNSASETTLIKQQVEAGKELAAKSEAARLVAYLNQSAEYRAQYTLDIASGISRLNSSTDDEILAMIEANESYDATEDLGNLQTYAERGQGSSALNLLSGAFS